MKLIKKIISLLSAKEKKQGILVLLIAIFMAIFEVLGVASVTPFLAVMSDPSIVESNSALSKIYKDLNWIPEESFESGLEKTVHWYVNNFSWLKKMSKQLFV